MSRRDERQKASKVFNEADFVFAQKVSFDEAFPQIEDIVTGAYLRHALQK